MNATNPSVIFKELCQLAEEELDDQLASESFNRYGTKTPIFSPTPSCRTTAKKLGDFEMNRVLKRTLLGNGLRLSLEGV